MPKLQIRMHGLDSGREHSEVLIALPCIYAQVLPEMRKLMPNLSWAQVLARQIIQYAKHIGIRTVNVVRRDEQIEELKALGCDTIPDQGVFLVCFEFQCAHAGASQQRWKLKEWDKSRRTRMRPLSR